MNLRLKSSWEAEKDFNVLAASLPVLFTQANAVGVWRRIWTESSRFLSPHIGGFPGGKHSSHISTLFSYLFFKCNWNETLSVVCYTAGLTEEEREG